MYVNIKDIDELRFSGCNGCTNNCCDGSRISLSPLILDDFEEVYKNFAILFAKIDREVKPVIVLNDGKSPCNYYKNGMCEIYDTRAPACKMYPISPYIDGNIYVDTSCQGAGSVGDFLCNKDEYNEKYYHKRVDNITQKINKTFILMEQIRDDLIESITVKDMLLYKYNGSIENDFIDMHKKSLIFL